jgi:rhodanese-related sulfurtransferase
MKGEVSVQELKELMEKGPITLVDVRSPEEFNDGAVEGAVNMPVQELPVLAKELKGKTVYLMCRSGGRSMIAFRQLEALGFEDIYNVKGGILAWIKQGYSLNV